MKTHQIAQICYFELQKRQYTTTEENFQHTNNHVTCMGPLWSDSGMLLKSPVKKLERMLLNPHQLKMQV